MFTRFYYQVGSVWESGSGFVREVEVGVIHVTMTLDDVFLGDMTKGKGADNE